MTERTVTIRLGIQDKLGDRLLEIKKQRDALLSRSTVNLRVNADSFEQARKASAQVRAESVAVMKDLSALGGHHLQSRCTFGPIPGAHRQRPTADPNHGIRRYICPARVSVEFLRQKTLAQFWGTSGAMFLGINAMKNSLTGFLAGGGVGFTKDYTT